MLKLLDNIAVKKDFFSQKKQQVFIQKYKSSLLNLKYPFEWSHLKEWTVKKKNKPQLLLALDFFKKLIVTGK
jgi:hypothetical protein